MTAAAHRPSQRERLLDSTLDLIRSGGAISMDSAARASGVSKPGLMYHFPTKQVLLEALIDHLINGYERDLEALLPDTARAVPEARIEAYLVWATTYVHDAADLVMLADPKLRIPMSERWADRLRAWVEIPADVPVARRARLNAVRLMADGCWYSEATGVLPVSGDDRRAVLDEALRLLRGQDA